jgi:transcriptional regulator with XRE-family HTH domain
MKTPVGNNLKKWRMHLGYSQEKIADFLNISRENISYYENGEREVPMKHIEKLANLFNVDPYLLFDDNMNIHESEMAFAFRNNEDLSVESMEHISQFKTIINNYLMMSEKMKTAK